jgi:hypothetical protein
MNGAVERSIATGGKKIEKDVSRIGETSLVVQKIHGKEGAAVLPFARGLRCWSHIFLLRPNPGVFSETASPETADEIF